MDKDNFLEKVMRAIGWPGAFLLTQIARCFGCSGIFWVIVIRFIRGCPALRARLFFPWVWPPRNCTMVLLDRSCIEWLRDLPDLPDPYFSYLLTDFWQLWFLPRGFSLYLMTDPLKSPPYTKSQSKFRSLLGCDASFWVYRREQLLEGCRKKKAALLNI